MANPLHLLLGITLLKQSFSPNKQTDPLHDLSLNKLTMTNQSLSKKQKKTKKTNKMSALLSHCKVTHTYLLPL